MGKKTKRVGILPAFQLYKFSKDDQREHIKSVCELTGEYQGEHCSIKAISFPNYNWAVCSNIPASGVPMFRQLDNAVDFYLGDTKAWDRDRS